MIRRLKSILGLQKHLNRPGYPQIYGRPLFDWKPGESIIEFVSPLKKS